MDAGDYQNVFGLSEAQIARRVKAAVRASDLPQLGEFQRSQRACMVQRDAARAPHSCRRRLSSRPCIYPWVEVGEI